MTKSMQMYIGQQLKNLQHRRKNNRRIGSILSQIKLQQIEDQLSKNKLKQLDYIAYEFENNTANNRKSKINKTSILIDKLQLKSNQICKKKDHKRGLSQQFRIKKTSRFKMARQSQQKPFLFQRSQLINYIANRQERIHTNPLKCNQIKKPQIYLNSICLQSQNYHKLNSFIRGAYDLNEFSDVINLNQLDRYRRDFYVFGKLYNEVAESNVENKMTLKDVQSQKFRDVVFINEQKDHSTAPEFRTILRDLKIIR